MCDGNNHLVLVGWVQFVPGLWVVLPVPEATNMERFRAWRRKRERERTERERERQRAGEEKKKIWGGERGKKEQKGKDKRR